MAASSNAPSHAPGRGKGLGESQEGGTQDRGDSSHGPHYIRVLLDPGAANSPAAPQL